ncbi:MAG TPA: phosphate signaling complex protein PhoU [Terriglobales bacterium]
MTRTRFHQGLEVLKQRLLAMGGLAEQAVDRAAHSYQERDLQLCQLVLEAERSINLAQSEIDELATDLLAMQQPMAIDLRFILAVIKMNEDLERVGDQAVNIVERVMDISTLSPAEIPADIPKMAAIAVGMVRQALEAFAQGSPALAQTVLQTDDAVDDMNRNIFLAMDKLMHNSPEYARHALDALLIARNLERVADHATNIAEDVIFWIEGADVRHRSSSSGRHS